MSGIYNMTIEQVQELIVLKHQLEDAVERVMMSQCYRACPYKECPLDTKEGGQLRTTTICQNAADTKVGDE